MLGFTKSGLEDPLAGVSLGPGRVEIPALAHMLCSNSTACKPQGLPLAAGGTCLGQGFPPSPPHLSGNASLPGLEELHFLLYTLAVDVALPYEALTSLESRGGLLQMELHGHHEVLVLPDGLLSCLHRGRKLRTGQSSFLQEEHQGLVAVQA